MHCALVLQKKVNDFVLLSETHNDNHIPRYLVASAIETSECGIQASIIIQCISTRDVPELYYTRLS